MTRSLVFAALVATSFAASAKAPPAPAESRRIVVSAVVYGEDLCPVAQGDEIVVCARKPENERYRIPKDLRPEPESDAAQAWTSRVAAIESLQRDMLPGHCSVIGTAGQFGCYRAASERWALERRALKRASEGP